jgi:tetratricopeptide (TPR) repeat protein
MSGCWLTGAISDISKRTTKEQSATIRRLFASILNLLWLSTIGGVARANSGDKQGAISDYTEAIRLDPQDAKAYSNRGANRAALGDRQGAMTDYNEAIRLNPQDPFAYVNRGNTRAELGDKRGGITDYNEAIRLNPQFALAYNNRGMAREKLGDRQGAIADYQKAADLARAQRNQRVYDIATQNLRRLQP